MNATIKITRELLTELQNNGYQVLLRKNKNSYYEALKDEIDEASKSISITPLEEDELMAISEALEHFEVLDLGSGLVLDNFDIR